MKILFVLPELYPHPGGGLATYYINHLLSIKPYFSKIDVIVGSSTQQGLESVKWEGINIRYLTPNLYQKYLPLFSHFASWPEIQGHLAASWALYEQVDAGRNYDIIETTDWGLNYLPFSLNGHKNLITRLHGSIAQIEHYDPRDNFFQYAHLIRMLETDTLSIVSQLLTHSHNNRDFWEDALGKKVHHIYPIFQLTKYSSVSLFESFPKHQYALVVGRIQAWKGAEVLCEALSNIEVGIPIYWMGRDTSYKQMKTSYSEYLAKKYPEIWGKKIIPVNPRPNEECRIWMENATFGIVPSTWDMFNLTIIEWITAEKPVVCSKGAGGYTVLNDASLVANANDAESLKNAILNALKLTEQQKVILVNRQLQYYQDICNIETLVSQNLEIYNFINKQNKNMIEPVKTNWRFQAYFPCSPLDRTAQLDQWPLKEIFQYSIKRLITKMVK